MTKPFRVDNEADKELEAAAVWYEDQRAGLGEEFLRSVQEAIDQIRAFPSAGALHPQVPEDLQARRVLVQSFPYAVVYLELPDEIRVLAVAHMKRRPGYWMERQDRPLPPDELP